MILKPEMSVNVVLDFQLRKNSHMVNCDRSFCISLALVSRDDEKDLFR